MKAIGEQLNFQTLFCELRLENEHLAPRFSVTWNTAEVRPRSHVRFKFAFVVACVLLVVSLFSIALWLNGRTRNQHVESAVVNPAANPTIDTSPRAMEVAPKPIALQRPSYRFDSARRAMKLAEVRRLRALALEKSEIRNAVAVSSWQSSTAMLMESPADDLLTSLPQLYRSVTQLNSFLSDTQK